MAKRYIALKAFRGEEGAVRVGQVLEGLADTRAEQLKRNRLIDDYSDKMAAAPRNQAMRSPADPPGLTSPNAGGLVELGWNPDGRPSGDGTSDGTDAEGNGEAATTVAPIGSSTSPTESSSSSPPAPPPATSTSNTSSDGRPKRGRRPSS